MKKHSSPPLRLRRRAIFLKRFAVALLAISIIGLIAWETFTGPHPEEFGYRFSPMYSFTWQGFGFWVWVAAVLFSIGLINYSWIGREIMIHCPHCGHDTSSKDEWVCSSCGKENRPRYGGVKDSFYTVLTRCKHCGTPPAAFQCPRCEQPIALDAEADTTRYAYRRPDGDSPQNG